MATETRTTTPVSTVTSTDWAAGAIGGFVGSIFFGLIMQYVIPASMQSRSSGIQPSRRTTHS